MAKKKATKKMKKAVKNAMAKSQAKPVSRAELVMQLGEATIILGDTQKRLEAVNIAHANAQKTVQDLHKLIGTLR